jgi:hypothetical protein
MIWCEVIDTAIRVVETFFGEWLVRARRMVWLVTSSSSVSAATTRLWRAI